MNDGNSDEFSAAKEAKGGGGRVEEKQAQRGSVLIV